MGVEDLYFSEGRMEKYDARRGFAYKPVATHNIYWRAIERVGVYFGSNDRKTGVYCQSSSQRTTNWQLNIWSSQ